MATVAFGAANDGESRSARADASEAEERRVAW